MYKEKSIAVVVPAYNEEQQILKVTNTMPNFVDAIIVVDDCSNDKTVEVVNNSALDKTRITILTHEKNQGVGAAIATGYKYARDNNFDIAVVMAGDAQMNPDDLPRLLDPIVEGRVDYAKGNRLIYNNAYNIIPKVRFFGNAVLSFLTKIASGYWHVADSQAGYTAINSTALHVVAWDKMYKRYGQPNDLLVKLNVHSFRVVDVPIEPLYDVGEKSDIKICKVIFTISWLLVKLFFWRLKEKYIIRDFHPLVLFYFIGMALLFFSIILAIRLVIVWSSTGIFPDVTGLGLLFSWVSGLQSIFFAMWFDSEYDKR